MRLHLRPGWKLAALALLAWVTSGAAAAQQAVKLNAPLAAGTDVDLYELSPNGNLVVYVASLATGASGLHRVPSGGGPSVLRAAGARRDFAFTPDSKRLVYHRSTVFPASNLESVPLGNGTPAPLGTVFGATGLFAFYFRLVPDGSRVVYHGSLDGDAVAELASVPVLGGAPTQLSAPLAAPYDLLEVHDIGPDGARVLYSVGYDYDGYIPHELHSAAVAGGSHALLWSSDCPLFDFCNDLWHARIAAAGERAVFTAAGGIYSVPIQGGPVTPLGTASSFHLSPDGGRVLFFAAGLLSVDVAGGPATALTPAGAIVDSSIVAFSADGNDVFYQARHPGDAGLELWRVPITGGTPMRVSGSLGPSGRVFNAPIPTPDGSRVLFAADRDLDETYEIYSVPATGGAVTKLSPAMVAGGDSFWAVATSDGRHALFIADAEVDEVRELYAARVDGSWLRKLNGPLVAGGDVVGFRVSADGSRLVYQADQDQNDVLEIYASQLRFQCNDETDNDADGLVDYPADPGCASETSAWELGAPPPACGLGPELAGLLLPLAARRRRGLRGGGSAGRA